jgi:hypothetical protein
MGYIDPQGTHNPAAGGIPPAAWGDLLRDNQEWMARNRPHCLAKATAAQSLPNATWTKIALAGETYDVGGCHSTVTNNSRFIVPAGGDGKYRFIARASFAVASGGSRQARLLLNNSLIIGDDVRGSVNWEMGFQVCSPAEVLVAGDYVELEQFQDFGSSINTGSNRPWLYGWWEAVS